jgi:hypothetical protein
MTRTGDREALDRHVHGDALSDLSAVIEAAPSAHHGERPTRAISAAELGLALGVSDEVVRQREEAGDLFSVVFPQRGPERVYPAFQAWPEIAGKRLMAVLVELKLRQLGGAVAYQFFMLRDDVLGYVTPVEMLIESVTSARPLERWMVEGLGYPAEERLEIVLGAARNHVAIVEGW